MELTGRITADVMRISGGKAVIMLEIDKAIDAIKCHEKYKDKELDIEVKQHREKRSLDANGYFWVLVDKMAKKTNISKIEIYRRYVKDIGGNSITVCVTDDKVEKVKSGWERKGGFGWIVDTFPSKINGCTNMILYEGSSEYDTKQMSRLINFAVQDAHSCDIDTRTPNEIAEMLSLWGQNEKSV